MSFDVLLTSLDLFHVFSFGLKLVTNQLKGQRGGFCKAGVLVRSLYLDPSMLHTCQSCPIRTLALA